MNRRLPSWIALAASGLIAAASAFAQGGENPRPAGDQAAGAHPSATTDKQADTKAAKKAGAQHADMHAKDAHAKDMHAKGKDSKHAKSKKAAHKDKVAGSTSGAGTAAARGLNAQMSRCTSMTDRRERAECARTAWEREHGTSG